MKKLIFLFAIMITAVTLFAQNPDAAVVVNPDTIVTAETVNNLSPEAVTPKEDLEKSIVEHFVAAGKDFLQYIDWLFMIVFIIITWLTSKSASATNMASWLNWLAKVPNLLIALGIGLILTVIFYYLFDYSGKEGIRTMLMSLLFSLVVYKIGIDKFLKWLFGKIGLKFE